MDPLIFIQEFILSERLTFGVLGDGFCSLVARVVGGHEDLLDDEAAHGVAHKDDGAAAHTRRQQTLQDILRSLVYKKESSRLKQNKTGQDRTGQDKTRQDKI
jgi:hypothetical protein